MSDTVSSSGTPPSSNTSRSTGLDDWGSGFLSFAKRRNAPLKTKQDTLVTEWPSMGLLSAFTRRRSARALERARSAGSSPALEWKSSTKWTAPKTVAGNVATSSRVKKLEAELTAASEKINNLELRIASRDAVLRRRALMLQEDAERITALEAEVTAAEERATIAEELTVDAEARATDSAQTAVELAARIVELERFAVKIATAQKERLDDLNDQLTEKETAITISEAEVRRVVFEHRPRPVQRAVRTILCASTGAIVALASIAAR